MRGIWLWLSWMSGVRVVNMIGFKVIRWRRYSVGGMGLKGVRMSTCVPELSSNDFREHGWFGLDESRR